MADTKLTALSGFTPILTDLVYGVDDPGGTPVSGKLTLDAILTLFEANIVVGADQVDDSAAANKFTTADDISKLAAIEASADVTDATNVGAAIHGASAKTTPVDADTVPVIDSEAANVLKKVTWANVKATLKTYFDTLYQPLAAALTSLASQWTAASASEGASLKFHEDTDNGTNYVRVIAPASIAANADITLPGVAATLATLAGTETLQNKTIVDPVITGAILEDIYTITDGAAFEIDPSNGTLQEVTLGANRTPKATNFANGESTTLRVADGTAYTITWTDATFGGSGVVWVHGLAPTLATSGYTVIELWKIGGQVYGAYVGDVA